MAMFLVSAKHRGQPIGIPSLLSLCQRVLMRHLDKLSDVGDTPIRLLHPLLRHATAQQLAHIEACNPKRDLETDSFWHALSDREFGAATPDELKRLGRGSWKVFFAAKTKALEDKKMQLGKRLQNISRSLEEEKQARGARMLEKPPVVQKKRKEGPDCPHAPPPKAALMSKSLKDFQQTRAVRRPRGPS